MGGLVISAVPLAVPLCPARALFDRSLAGVGGRGVVEVLEFLRLKALVQRLGSRIVVALDAALGLAGRLATRRVSTDGDVPDGRIELAAGTRVARRRVTPWTTREATTGPEETRRRRSVLAAVSRSRRRACARRRASSFAERQVQQQFVEGLKSLLERMRRVNQCRSESRFYVDLKPPVARTLVVA